MPVGYSRYLKTILTAGDFILLNLCFYLVSLYYRWPNLTVDPVFLAQFLYINFFWVFTTFTTGIHRMDRGQRIEEVTSQLLRALALFGILIISFLFFFEDKVLEVRNFEAKLLVFATVFLLWRAGMFALLGFMRRRGLNFRRVIIVGNGQPAREMQKFFVNHPEVGYRLEGVFCDESDLIEKKSYRGKVSDVEGFALENRVDEIYCSLSGLEPEQVSHLMNFADRSLIRFKVVPDFRGFLNRRVRIDFYDLVPVLSVRHEPLQNYPNQFLKRSFDLLFSALVLLTVFPVAYLIFAPLIKWSSPGPVFFKQLRSGKDNKVFTCWKFRTMRQNAQADQVQASAGDVRITGVGRFLRKTSLDELPQFYNTLIGNMSVVGPRPHMLRHTEEYRKMIDQFMVRHFVKPGITGWSQIQGFRGETSDPVLMEKRVEGDVWYLENWSLLLDIKIIVLTVVHIFSGRNQGD